MPEEQEFSTASPVPLKDNVVEGLPTLSFYDALKEVAAGKRITKLEWADLNIYGILTDGEVMIMLSDGLLHPWKLSEGDLNGTDWIVLE